MKRILILALSVISTLAGLKAAKAESINKVNSPSNDSDGAIKQQAKNSDLLFQKLVGQVNLETINGVKEPVMRHGR